MKERKKSDRLWWIGHWGFAFGVAAAVGWVVNQVVISPVTLSEAHISLISFFLILIFVGMILHFYNNSPDDSLLRPRLILYKSDNRDVFVFSPTEWLNYGLLYALFVTEEDGFERLLGVAEVLNIQDDKNVQLLVVERSDESSKIWESLDAGSKDHFSSINIKPGMPKLG